MAGELGRVSSKGADGEGRVELAAKEEDGSPLHGSHARMHGASCTRRRNEMTEGMTLGTGGGKWQGGTGSVGVVRKASLMVEGKTEMGVWQMRSKLLYI